MGQHRACLKEHIGRQAVYADGSAIHIQQMRYDYAHDELPKRTKYDVSRKPKSPMSPHPHQALDASRAHALSPAIQVSATES